VPIADIAAFTRLAMPELVAADRMPATVTEVGWRLVEQPDEILL
jgi:endonuclease G